MARRKTRVVREALKLAVEIARLRNEDPAHYRRVMRKLAEIEARRAA